MRYTAIFSYIWCKQELGCGRHKTEQKSWQVENAADCVYVAIATRSNKVHVQIRTSTKEMLENTLYAVIINRRELARKDQADYE